MEKETEKMKCGEIAKLSQACEEKIKKWEHELNALGCWNVALVAYQLTEQK